MSNLGKYTIAILLVICVVFSNITLLGAAGEVEEKTQIIPNPLTIESRGLSGELLVVLNDKEKLNLKGDGTFKFESQLEEGASYSVKIDKMPANHRCELKKSTGTIGQETPEVVEAVCREIGKWTFPSSLNDAVNSSGQNGAEPAVVIDNNGNAVAVWAQFDGSLWRLIHKEYRDGKWLQEKVVSPPARIIERPVVVMVDNGDLVIVWEQVGKGKRNIMMAERRKGVWHLPKSDADQISIGQKFASEADVDMNNSGETVIVWSQASASGLNAIYKSEYRDGSWRHPKDINDQISPEGNDALRARVAINSSGDALVAWEQAINNVSQIFKSEFRGNKWSHPADPDDYINPKTDEKNRGSYFPMVAIDDAGMAVIAWQQAHGAKDRIYLSEYRGGNWHHPRSIDKAISPPEFIVSKINDLRMDRKGNVLILWTAYQARKHYLYKSEYRQGKWSHPAAGDTFVTPPRSSFKFFIAGKASISASGKAVAVWLQRGFDRRSIVYFAEYDNNSWYLPGQPLNIGDNMASKVVVSSSERGDSIIAWQQSDGKNDRIFTGVFRMLK